MGHQSENANRLSVQHETLRSADLEEVPAPSGGDILLVVPPYGRSIQDFGRSPAYLGLLRRLAGDLAPEGLLCVLTSPQDAAETITLLENSLRFQLWVAVKLQKARPNPSGLSERHASLVVLSKAHAPLRHTKTRIEYTYCPACNKTTKDYGGKKHVYHQYGTLMSDIWRDIAWAPAQPPVEITERLADLFGLDPHRRLRVIDLRAVALLKPRALRSRPPVLLFPEPSGIVQESELGSSRLLKGDCLLHLAKLPGNCVDFCFADPPYNLNKTYDKWDDSLEIRSYFQWCDRWLGELSRVLKPGRTCAILNIPLWAVRHFQFLKTRLQFQNWIVWEGLGLPVRMIMPAHYSIVCFSKGPARPLPGQAHDRKDSLEDQATRCLREFFCTRLDCLRKRALGRTADTEPISDLWWDIHRLKHNSRRADHPCQLPPALMRRLIACFTVEGETVLDPFNGVGTTTLCARQLNRGYLGIELSDKYHAIALDRHGLLDRGGDPFAKNDAIPKAKNSRVPRIGQQHYVVTKKTLQLEVKAIARQLGRLPTREDVRKHSRYPIEYFEQYFVSWGEVCAAARTTGMSEIRVG